VEENSNLHAAIPSWASNRHLLQVSVAAYTNEMVANGRKNGVINICHKPVVSSASLAGQH